MATARRICGASAFGGSNRSIARFPPGTMTRVRVTRLTRTDASTFPVKWRGTRRGYLSRRETHHRGAISGRAARYVTYVMISPRRFLNARFRTVFLLALRRGETNRPHLTRTIPRSCRIIPTITFNINVYPRCITQSGLTRAFGRGIFAAPGTSMR